MKDNMKECEIFSNIKVPCGSKIIIRIDGRKFSKLSHDLKLEKPYDIQFVKNMVEVSYDFFKEFSPTFIYTFSDEINILLSEIPFAGRIEKINSIFASFFASAFMKAIIRNSVSLEDLDNGSKPKPPTFDSRVIPLSKEEAIEYFKMRQNEAWRNCINGYAYWTLREEYEKKEAVKILKDKKSSQMHDILFERGMNIAEAPAWQRRGVGIYKKEVEIEGYNPITEEKVLSKRKKPFVNWNLPIFDAAFFNDNLIL